MCATLSSIISAFSVLVSDQPLNAEHPQVSNILLYLELHPMILRHTQCQVQPLHLFFPTYRSVEVITHYTRRSPHVEKPPVDSELCVIVEWVTELLGLEQ